MSFCCRPRKNRGRSSNPSEIVPLLVAAAAKTRPGFWRSVTERFKGWVALTFGYSPKVNADKHTVWLTDNTAWRIDGQADAPWKAEFVGAYFAKDSGADASEFVAAISEFVGIADDPGERETVEERVQPFVDQILPGYSVDINFGDKERLTLGPANAQGISSNEIKLPGGPYHDGQLLVSNAVDHAEVAPFDTVFAGPRGWTVVSDVDDTIKESFTYSPVRLAQATFVDPPKAVPGMSEFYAHLTQKLLGPPQASSNASSSKAAPSPPAFFYLTASPYNLYQFLRSFRRDFNYPPGTMILRDASWMTLAGFLATLTQGTRSYKLDRLEKINRWLPNRATVCIGDSTQADAEVYAEMYRKHPNWVRAIYVRRVPAEGDSDAMDDKNSDKRFEKAFKGVPKEVWRTFDDPSELYGAVDTLLAMNPNV